MEPMTLRLCFKSNLFAFLFTFKETKLLTFCFPVGYVRRQRECFCSSVLFTVPQILVIALPDIPKISVYYRQLYFNSLCMLNFYRPSGENEREFVT